MNQYLKLFLIIASAIICGGLVLNWILGQPRKMVTDYNKEIGFKAELERRKAQIV